MSKKNTTKNIIHGMNHLQRAWLEVHPTTKRFIIKMPAKEIFDDIENKQIISKESYIKLYESWSKTDIEQITGLLLLIRDHIYVETDLSDDEKGDYGDFTVENQTEKYIVRVYAPNDFLMAMSVHHFENCYHIPDFSIQELYKLAQKAE